MKKKIIIGAGIALIVVVGVFIMLQTNKNKKYPERFSERCWEEVKDYTISETENGMFTVELKAPDYKELLKKIAGNNEEIVVTDDILMNLSKENKDALKQYMFSVETNDIEVIKEAYFNEIGNDICELIIETYTEANDTEGQ